jgi:hypothetical protein
MLPATTPVPEENSAKSNADSFNDLPMGEGSFVID